MGNCVARVRLGFTLAAASAGLALATPAAAVPLLFSFTGDLNGSFIVDSNPVPVATSSTSTIVHMSNAAGDFLGESTNEFFLASDGGGFLTGPLGKIETFDPQFFSGTLANPVFAPGKFVVTDFTNTLFSDVSVSSAPGAPAPELSTGLLAGLTAFAALVATRRRRRAVPA